MTTEAASNTLALSANWLNTSNVAYGDPVQTTVGYSNSMYPWYYAPTVTTWYPATRIRLTMTEVERLRAAAKKDTKLRETLAKFTDCIEVVVDFGE